MDVDIDVTNWSTDKVYELLHSDPTYSRVCCSIGVYGVNAAVPTGFETGKWGLPTTYQIMKLIELVGLNANNKTDFNRAIDKFNAAGNFYGSGYYFWTCAEYSAGFSFVYYGGYGGLPVDVKIDTCSVRPVLALEWDA